jgi:hypothetical protein
MMFGLIIEMVTIITALIGQLKVLPEDLLISHIISHFKTLPTPINLQDLNSHLYLIKLKIFIVKDP